MSVRRPFFIIVFMIYLSASGLSGVEAATVDSNEPTPNSILAKEYPETVFFSGGKQTKEIALTFDDGPDPRVTSDLLDVLKEEDVPATFFLLGARAKAYPELVRRTHNEGHLIGNHGYWHNPIIQLSDKQARFEIEQTQQVIEQIIGVKTSLYRPPFGLLNEQKVEVVKDLGYSIILWSVDTEDWKASPPDQIVETVLETVKPGAIILHHDGSNWDTDLTGTVTAVKKEISELKKQGYTFVTVDDLLEFSE
ncbi:polysaccharide deacetylase family protein [Alkalicoccobacillus gibsonii]|uniref:polysaccharide deacetylase family protein n=1 Tax=Alkalicoccobacillus gibsonii TaxID=79881 RepID=UPI0019318EC6|nr:polysaccharide deacetylase family protein [Alkalicoccobacillus gibsonii]MBM0064536.1 polysaccharide deacetylase family protein [Alkalicoccobacillus gibsonii]